MPLAVSGNTMGTKSSRKTNVKAQKGKRGVDPAAQVVHRGALELTHFLGRQSRNASQLSHLMAHANQTIREALRLGGPEMALTDARVQSSLRDLAYFFPTAAAMMREVLVERAQVLRRLRLLDASQAALTPRSLSRLTG